MEYIFKITEQELHVLSAALVELPYKMSAPLIDKLNRQIAEQQSKKDMPAPSGASPDNL